MRAAANRSDYPGPGHRTYSFLARCLAAGLSLGGIAVSLADSLVWRDSERRVDADVSDWPLDRLLGTLAKVSGWEILVEPGASHRASATFRDLPVSEALDRLLGDLNFAVLPRSSGPPKLLVFRNALANAVRPVRPRGPRPILEEIVLSVRTDSEELIAALRERFDARVVDRIGELGLFRLAFPDAETARRAREWLSTQDGLEDAAALNFELPRPDSPLPVASPTPDPPEPEGSSGSVDAGESLLKARVNEDGSVLIVGLVDTPVQGDQPWLEPFLLPGIDLIEPGTPPADTFTHGTAMAGTVLRGVDIVEGSDSTPIRILPVDVYGNGPTTTTFDVARGVYAAIDGGARIVNLSLGTDEPNPYLESMISHYSAQGVLFIGAAGNEPTDRPTFPAAYPDVLAVTAGSSAGIADYANYGAFVDVVAPGESPVRFNDRVYLGSGTSFSSALVSGLAAGIATQPGQSLESARAAIQVELGSPLVAPPAISGQ